MDTTLSPRSRSSTACDDSPALTQAISTEKTRRSSAGVLFGAGAASAAACAEGS